MTTEQRADNADLATVRLYAEGLEREGREDGRLGFVSVDASNPRLILSLAEKIEELRTVLGLLLSKRHARMAQENFYEACLFCDAEESADPYGELKRTGEYRPLVHDAGCPILRTDALMGRSPT